MYRSVPRSEISEALEHLRDLHRQNTPSNDRDQYASERRELLTKNLLSNLHRTREHPTLSMLLEIADMFSLTVEGAHRLFGYDLGVFGDYERQLNSRRTRIVESLPRWIVCITAYMFWPVSEWLIDNGNDEARPNRTLLTTQGKRASSAIAGVRNFYPVRAPFYDLGFLLVNRQQNLCSLAKFTQPVAAADSKLCLRLEGSTLHESLIHQTVTPCRHEH